jgi:hypothetical protein
MQFLYSETTGLTAKGIQRKIIINELKNQNPTIKDVEKKLLTTESSYKKAEGHEKERLGKRREIQKKLILEMERFDGFEEFEKTKMSIEDLLKATRGQELEVPSHITIADDLNNMYNHGLVGRRMFPEKKKLNFVYFLNPKIYAMLKDIEKRYKESPDAPFFEMWERFFII